MQGNRQLAILMFYLMSALILHMSALYRNTKDLVSTVTLTLQCSKSDTSMQQICWDSNVLTFIT